MDSSKHSLSRPFGPAVVLATVFLFSLPCYGATSNYSFPNANCTVAALKSPSWEIRNFTYDSNSRFYYGPGTAGTVSFSIKNTANGYQFNCLQGSGQDTWDDNHFLRNGKVWYSCNVFCYGADRYPWQDNPPLETSFHYDMVNKELIINQQWTCDGGNWNTSKETTFLGTGNTIIKDMRCSQTPNGRDDQVACSPVDVSISATVSPIPVTATPTTLEPEDDPARPQGLPPRQYPTSPPAVLHNTKGCSKVSQRPSWNVTNFYYTGLGIRFLLTNSVLNYTTRCNLGDLSGRSVVDRNMWYNCSRYDSMHATYPYDGIYTQVYYGGTENCLRVNQTWYCDDENESNPTVFSAVGETVFRINCNQTRECLPGGPWNEKPNAIIQDFCNAADMTLTPAQLNTAKITKAQALEVFTPHGYNCSSRSLGTKGGKPMWEVSSFIFNRTWNSGWDTPGFQDEAAFYYNNTATDSDWPVSNQAPRLCNGISSTSGPLFDGTQEINCNNFYMYSPGFKFDYNTSLLTLFQQWVCDGIDREHTNHFDALGSVKLALDCKAAGNGTSCTMTDKIAIPMGKLTTTLNALQ